MGSIQRIIWYLVSFFFKTLFPLVTIPILTNYISKEEFGIYALCMFYGTFGSGLANLGLLSAFERNFFEETSNDKKKLLWNILIVVSLSFMFVLLLSYTCSHFISNKIFQIPTLNEYLTIGLFFQGLKSINLYFLAFWKNSENPRKYTLLSLIESVSSILTAIFLVVYFSMGLFGFILGQIIGVFLTVVINFSLILYPFYYKMDLNLIKRQLNLSLPLTPRVFFGVINTQFDRYMLGLLDTLGAVGIYDIGQKIANTSFTFMTSVQNVFSPQVYKKLFSDNENTKNSVGAYLTPFFFICVLFCLSLSIFSSEIIIILTPKEFHDAAPIISILSILYSFYFFGKQPQLLYAKKTTLISLLSLVSMLLNVILNIPMIKYYGVYGAAYATTLAGVISTAISFYYGQKYSFINYEKFLIWILIYYLVSVLFVNTYFSVTFSIFQITIKLSIVIIYICIGLVHPKIRMELYSTVNKIYKNGFSRI